MRIAMKFEGEDAGDRLIGVSVCSEDQDVLLATRAGRAMRFPVSTVRVFASRNSTGVRGISLAEGDEVISMSLVDGGKGVTSEERDAYLRQSRALRQLENQAESGEEEVAAGRLPGAVVMIARRGRLGRRPRRRVQRLCRRLGSSLRFFRVRMLFALGHKISSKYMHLQSDAGDMGLLRNFSRRQGRGQPKSWLKVEPTTPAAQTDRL